MANTATVQGYKFNEKGRLKVQLDGQWYNVGNKCDLSEAIAPVGTRVSFDSSSSDWNGKAVWWLNTYAKLPATTNGVHAVPAQPPVQTRATPTPPAGMSEGERLCVSNWVAAAIHAGRLPTPDALDIWVKASLAAIRGVPLERQPGEDDDKF